MTSLSSSRRVGDHALAVVLGVAEVGAMLLSALVMSGVVVVSQIVRMAVGSRELRLARRGASR
jgi:hypothetical protein